jgi:rubrerythrin
MSLVKRGTWAKKDEVSQLSHSIYVCNQCGYMAEKKDSTGEFPKCKIISSLPNANFMVLFKLVNWI